MMLEFNMIKLLRVRGLVCSLYFTRIMMLMGDLPD